jgi:hypothetical protein
MSFPVVFRRIAKREFDDAISWYEDRREGLGRDFSVAVEQLLERIALSPNQFACERQCAESSPPAFSILYLLRL